MKPKPIGYYILDILRGNKRLRLAVSSSSVAQETAKRLRDSGFRVSISERYSLHVGGSRELLDTVDLYWRGHI